MARNRESLAAALVALALLAPLAWASGGVLRAMGAGRPYDVDFVPRGAGLALASPGIRLSIANFYWLATVQYVGEPRGRERGFEKLFPLADLVTDLDPRHGYAYQTAGIVLSAEGRVDESDRILKKGMQPGRPGWWSFPFYLAFNQFFYRGNYAEAARWAQIAARTPGASTNISHLALALEVKSGSPDDAIRFLEELRATARDERTAEALDEQYRLALLQRDFRDLDDAVARFRERHGAPPARLQELVAAGEIPAVPEEPFGGSYRIDADGVVHSTARDQRFKPAGPGRLASPPDWRPPSWKAPAASPVPPLLRRPDP
jgi:tetratricopeptide (TPR) repeat protein